MSLSDFRSNTLKGTVEWILSHLKSSYLQGP